MPEEAPDFAEAALAFVYWHGPATLVFEIEAAILLANAQYVVARTSEPIKRGRRSVERRLAGAHAS